MPTTTTCGLTRCERSRSGGIHESNARGENALVFGRVTYDVMAALRGPPPEAAKAMPEVAKGMNDSPKYVFSRTSTLRNGPTQRCSGRDPAAEIARNQADLPARTL